MNQNLNSLKGLYSVLLWGLFRGDARSLDYGSYGAYIRGAPHFSNDHLSLGSRLSTTASFSTEQLGQTVVHQTVYRVLITEPPRDGEVWGSMVRI